MRFIQAFVMSFVFALSGCVTIAEMERVRKQDHAELEARFERQRKLDHDQMQRDFKRHAEILKDFRAPVVVGAAAQPQAARQVIRRQQSPVVLMAPDSLAAVQSPAAEFDANGDPDDESDFRQSPAD